MKIIKVPVLDLPSNRFYYSNTSHIPQHTFNPAFTQEHTKGLKHSEELKGLSIDSSDRVDFLHKGLISEVVLKPFPPSQ